MHIKHEWELLFGVQGIIMVDEAIWCAALEEQQCAINNPQICWENEKAYNNEEYWWQRGYRNPEFCLCSPEWLKSLFFRPKIAL